MAKLGAPLVGLFLVVSARRFTPRRSRRLACAGAASVAEAPAVPARQDRPRWWRLSLVVEFCRRHALGKYLTDFSYSLHFYIQSHKLIIQV